MLAALTLSVVLHLLVALLLKSKILSADCTHAPQLEVSRVEFTLASKRSVPGHERTSTLQFPASSSLPLPLPPPELPPTDAFSCSSPVSVAPSFDLPPLAKLPQAQALDAEVSLPAPVQSLANSKSPANEAQAPAADTDAAKVEFPPQPVARFKPKYPRICRERGEEGVVSLDVEVDACGRAAKVSVALSSGFAKLDEAAVGAVRAAGFRPAARGGIPVSGRIRLPVVFRLNAR